MSFFRRAWRWLKDKDTQHQIKVVTAVTSMIAGAVGLVSTAWGVWHSARQAHADYADHVYDTLDQRYIDFEKLCLEHRKVDCADQALANPPKLGTEDERAEQTLVYNILLSIFERAHMSYASESPEEAKKQLPGWEVYMKSFAQRRAFLCVWEANADQYDTGFKDFMNTQIFQRHSESDCDGVSGPGVAHASK